LSPWWPSPFELGGERFAPAEHHLMVAKARLFGDDAIAAHILGSTAPEEAHSLGREVRGFETATWASIRYDVAVAGNLAKFTQHIDLGFFLTRQTTDHVLAEANPNDRIWGIGLAANDMRAKRPVEWPGLNLLGFALMDVREQLRNNPLFA
jgi:ribA/ribD-fused uncharacterized protein